MSEPLHGAQWPKGLSDEEVRLIVKEECAKLISAIRDSVAITPTRADGNINAVDFRNSLDFLEKQYRSTFNNDES